jgi:hypothetical protein
VSADPIRERFEHETAHLGRRNRRRDDLLEEWDRLRGYVPFTDAHTRLGVTQAAWRRAYYRALADGDPRARKASTDHPGLRRAS